MGLHALRQKKTTLQLSSSVLALFRRCLRLTKRLEYDHQYTWYHYTKLKFEENRSVRDPKKIKLLLEQADDEIMFVEKILASKWKNNS